MNMLNDFWAADEVVQLIGILKVGFRYDVLDCDILIVDLLGQSFFIQIKMPLCKLNTFWCWIDARNCAHAKSAESFG